MTKFFGALLAVMTVAGGEAFALPMATATFSDGAGNTGGGEFNAVTSANGNFFTYCLEYQEHISMGTTLYYEVSQAARWNGNGTMDPISRATAWLYLQCLDGTLASFGAAYAYDHSQSDANDIQRAFWYLEGEQNGANNYYAQLAAANAEGGMSDNDGFYSVGVMNLWTNSDGTGVAQDQLVRLASVPQASETVTVPDGGATIALLGLSLMATACLARRFKANELADSAQVR